MNYVYGGSFNPPTKAHRKIIELLSNLNDTEKVILIPVGDDYQKPYLAPFKDRLEMLEQVICEFPHVIISTIEQDDKYHGTLNSLKSLEKNYKPLSFVIGSDQIDELPQWINSKKLLKAYTFVIIQRDRKLSIEDIEKKFSHIPHHFKWIPFNQEVSATTARKNIDKRKKILDPKIIKYIEEHQLYKE
ncbi:nicotinate (nicotinamide) nucleotide adenylyltransferase [Mycoplasmatota bacterium]|nr:nicotinate (nicotinamide) nucleotide adenylyltransferase [Mycoplasmatota bacterium]